MSAAADRLSRAVPAVLVRPGDRLLLDGEALKVTRIEISPGQPVSITVDPSVRGHAGSLGAMTFQCGAYETVELIGGALVGGLVR